MQKDLNVVGPVLSACQYMTIDYLRQPHQLFTQFYNSQEALNDLAMQAWKDIEQEDGYFDKIHDVIIRKCRLV